MGELNSQKRRERRRIIRDMTIEQAQKELAELRLNLFNLRMQASRGEVKNVREFARTRKDIAAILHKMRMAQLEALYGDAFGEDGDEIAEEADVAEQDDTPEALNEEEVEK